MNKNTKWLKYIVRIALTIVLIYLVWPVLFVFKAYLSDSSKPYQANIPNGYVNDASRLDLTKVDTVLTISTDSTKAVQQLVSLVKYVDSTGKKVSIAGARHSMGGHTIYPNGIQVNMLPFNRMHLDESKKILYVQAGARWAEVILYLNSKGYSVSVMQSNNSFSVGGSISVNCHGWQNNSGPIASTVIGFDLIKANGEIIHCSRTENKELFGLVLGGYGLFGIILNVELKVVPNREYKSNRYVIASTDYVSNYAKYVDGHKEVEMAYGRLDISPDNFLKEAILNTYTADTTVKGILPLGDPTLVAARRSIFRSSVGSAYGKAMRWKAEKKLGEFASSKAFSRNDLLNEGVEIYEDRDTVSTDILHEYFIPRNKVNEFISAMQQIIPADSADLLNVTIREVENDTDTYMRYANGEVFGFVMLFNQAKTKLGEIKMEKLTIDLIDAALKSGGRYYLPYRLHATREQFYKAYPMANEFFRLKKLYDPKEVFNNLFYTKYN